MPDAIRWADFFQHAGGLNTRNTATTTPVYDATQSLNIEGIVKGGFRKTKGYTRFAQAPLLASGTIANGTLDLDGESDAWTGAGDATTFSTSAGIGTINEAAGATAHQRYHNAEAAFLTGTDATYETRLSCAGGTLSGVYAMSICVLDDETDRFELVAIETGGVKQIAVLTATADRTVIASYDAAYRVNHDWTVMTRYRVLYDASGNVTVYTNDLETAVITVAVSALPASTETARVAIGSFETATVISWSFDYIAYKIGALALDTVPFNGIYALVDETNSQEVLATAGTSVYSFTSATAMWTALTGGTAFTSGTRPYFVTWNDTSASNVAIAIMTTEARDVPQKYGGGGGKADLGGTPPRGKYIEIFNERCFIANTAAEPCAVYFSAFGDPEDRDSGSGTWDQANDVFLVDRFRHGVVTGLAAVNHKLIITCERGIYRLTGWGKGSFQLELVSGAVGCVGMASIVKAPYGDQRNEGIYFRDKEGYYWTDGEIGNVVRVSEKILTTIDEEFNKSQAGNDVGFLNRKRSIVGWGTSQGADTTNSVVYSLDYIQTAKQQEDGYRLEGWYPQDLPMRAVGRVRTSSTEDVILFADHLGLIHQMDSGDNYDGSSIDGYRSTAWVTLGALQYEKLWRFLVVYLKATGDIDLTVSWGINFQDTFSNQTTVNLAGSNALLGSSFVLGQSQLGTTGVIYAKIPLNIRGNSLRLKFSTSGADEPFTVLGFALGYEPLDWFEGNA